MPALVRMLSRGDCKNVTPSMRLATHIVFTFMIAFTRRSQPTLPWNMGRFQRHLPVSYHACIGTSGTFSFFYFEIFVFFSANSLFLSLPGIGGYILVIFSADIFSAESGVRQGLTAR